MKPAISVGSRTATAHNSIVSRDEWGTSPSWEDARLTCLYRHRTDAQLELVVRRYEGTSGDAIDASAESIAQTTDWGRLSRDLEPPEAAGAIRFYLRLYPPDSGEAAVRLDDIRLISWGDTPDETRPIDHIRVNGTATVSFTIPEHDDISWPPLDRG